MQELISKSASLHAVVNFKKLTSYIVTLRYGAALSLRYSFFQRVGLAILPIQTIHSLSPSEGCIS